MISEIINGNIKNLNFVFIGFKFDCLQIYLFNYKIRLNEAINRKTCR